MVGREPNSVSGKERVMRGLLIGLAVIGVVAIGLVAGGFLRTIPSMMTATRVHRVLDGTTPVQDFPITLADGTTTSLYAECSSADDVIVSFVSTGCGQCLEEMHTLSAGVPHKTGMRVTYLPITSEPQSMLNEYRTSTNHPYAIGWVSDAVFSSFGIEEVPQLVVVGSNHRVIRHLQGFDASIVSTLTDFFAGTSK